MKKILVLFLILTSAVAFSQKKKDKKMTKEEEKLLNSIMSDPDFAIRMSAQGACECIDSISVADKSNESIAKEISECIHKEVVSYQLISQIMKVSDKKENQTITLADDKNSADYKRNYYDLERWLRDSCTSLKTIAASNNEHNKYSVSDNEEALKYYNLASEKMSSENYEAAIPLLKKALEIDSKFAFCWDNLGICYRKTGKYKEAIDAYNNSLKVDPTGTTPLQNLAVVYEFQKDYPKAIFTYKNLINQHKKDPEGYYGLSRMYFMTNDYDNSLKNMCVAYNLYVGLSSPYRTDAEKMIRLIYDRMKKNGAENKFKEILKENNIQFE